MLGKMGGMKNPPALLLGVQIGTTTMDISVIVPQKARNKVAI